MVGLLTVQTLCNTQGRTEFFIHSTKPSSCRVQDTGSQPCGQFTNRCELFWLHCNTLPIKLKMQMETMGYQFANCQKSVNSVDKHLMEVKICNSDILRPEKFANFAFSDLFGFCLPCLDFLLCLDFVCSVWIFCPVLMGWISGSHLSTLINATPGN